jgi:hypothetical protein
MIYLGNGDQADQACPNCLDHGVLCVTSSSRGNSHRDKARSPYRYHSSDPSRGSAASRPIGLLSPDAMSVEFSIHPENIQIPEDSTTPALEPFDEPGERSSILPDDMVRHA